MKPQNSIVRKQTFQFKIMAKDSNRHFAKKDTDSKYAHEEMFITVGH